MLFKQNKECPVCRTKETVEKQAGKLNMCNKCHLIWPRYGKLPKVFREDTMQVSVKQ